MKKWLAILFPVQIIVFSLIIRQQAWIEKYYIPFIFNNITRFLRKITGWFQFSIGLFLLYFFVLCTICLFVKMLINLVQKKIKISAFFINVFCYISISYGIYMITWGLAYYRKSIAEIQYLDTKNIHFDEIKFLASSLIDLTNQTRLQIPDNEARADNFDYLLSHATQGYLILEKESEDLKYSTPSVKISFEKTILSYLNTAGIYSFFSGEANINSNSTGFEVPFTLCHEMAHQLGFASEEEANYVSYLACINNPKPIFKYSAYAEALQYTLRNIYEQDSTLYFQMKSTIDTAVINDFNYSKAKWNKYQLPALRKVSSGIYDLFLKSNNQESGIKSYGLMVELLIAHNRKHPLSSGREKNKKQYQNTTI
jgi:Protein of unknown function (DUF3810)